jgi:hypothetical protein
MRRPFAITTGALVLAVMPALLSAQTPAQPPAEQQAAGQDTQKPEEPPKVPFTTPAGALLVQIKPGQTAVFEEMVGKLKAGLAKTSNPTLQQQVKGFDVYKAEEPFGGNVLYVVMLDPAVPNAEYELFALLAKTMTEDELRAPETADMWKRYTEAFAAGLSKLSLTPVANGMM